MSGFFIKEKSLDDILNALYRKLLSIELEVSASKGEFKELICTHIILTNPRMRVSRSYSRGKIFSLLGELLWYFTGDNELDFIKYFLPNYPEAADENGKVNSGYGDRLFSYSHGTDNKSKINQIDNILNLLKRKPTSRQAVIQLFSAADLVVDRDSPVPCTNTLQFILRENQLHLLVNMRSNDAFKGLVHDVYAFTMIQELIATELQVEMGCYQHFVGSMHLYNTDYEGAQEYLSEGYFTPTPMPAMPSVQPLQSLQEAVKFAERVRLEGIRTFDNLPESNYWSDIWRLILAFALFAKDHNEEMAFAVRDELSSEFYRIYLDDRELRRRL